MLRHRRRSQNPGPEPDGQNYRRRLARAARRDYEVDGLWQLRFAFTPFPRSGFGFDTLWAVIWDWCQLLEVGELS